VEEADDEYLRLPDYRVEEVEDEEYLNLPDYRVEEVDEDDEDDNVSTTITTS